MAAEPHAPPPVHQPGRARRRRVIAVINVKGGSTKTSTAVNLAAALAAMGHTVRLTDLDPQDGSATLWLPPVTDVGQGLIRVFNEEATLDEATARTNVPNLFLVPSWESLREVERTRPPGAEMTMALALDDSDAPTDYEIFDCPHSKDVLAIAALVGASEMVVPLQASELDVVGMGSLLKLRARVQKMHQKNINITALVIARTKGNSGLEADLQADFTARFPDAVVLPVVDTVKMRQATAAHQPINVFDADSPATANFRELAQRIDALEVPA